jgi:hypothetical protein
MKAEHRLVGRVAIAVLLALLATLVCGSSAQADVTVDPGILGGEVLGNPVPGPVVPVPNVFPLPPRPVRVDAEAPPDDAEQPDEAGSDNEYEPVGKLGRAGDNYLKSKGVDAHAEKIGADLRPPSLFDIYIDREGKMFGVRKGVDPKFGTYLGPLPD